MWRGRGSWYKETTRQESLPEMHFRGPRIFNFPRVLSNPAHFCNPKIRGPATPHLEPVVFMATKMAATIAKDTAKRIQMYGECIGVFL